MDPRLSGDRLRQISKKVKSSIFDDPEAGNSERRMSTWKTDPGPIALSGLALDDRRNACANDCIPAHSQGQEDTEILENPLSGAITTPALAMYDLGTSYPRGRSPESLSSTCIPGNEDVGQLQPTILVQYPSEEETEIGDSLTSALAIYIEDLSHAAKLYWAATTESVAIQQSLYPIWPR